MSTVYQIADLGTDLSSRTSARKLRNALVDQVEHEGRTVVLDFSGVRSVSHSFADELLAVLIQSRGEAWFRRFVRVQNHEPYIRLTLLDAIDRRLNAALDAA
jgi:anti-anti-sigma regulatory factor